MDSNYSKYHFLKNGQLTACQVCGFGKLQLVLDLGLQPLSDSFLMQDMLNEPEAKYPLRMVWCERCSLAQIDYLVDPGIIYHSNYPYRSGVTRELVEYFSGFAEALISKYNLKPGNLVIDIGSNDGTLLGNFKKHGIKVLGVEPTNAGKVALQNGIPTIQGYFDVKIAKEILQKHGKASLVVSCMLLERAAQLGEVLSGVESLLEDGGTFVFETHYLKNIIEGGQFDAIYHEHLRIFSLTTLVKLFEHYNFNIVGAETGFINRGNLKVYAVKGKKGGAGESVVKFLKAEEAAGLKKYETYLKFSERVKKTKEAFLGLMYKIKAEGAKAAANSSPARSVVLLNYYGVGVDLLPYIAEPPTSPKQGMYLPGCHIPIVSRQKLLNEQPEYVVLLAWYYAEAIMKQLKQEGLKSDFIIPLPDLKIVKNSEV